jgi:hypothetical protein
MRSIWFSCTMFICCLSQALRVFALLRLHMECNRGFATFDFVLVHAIVGLKHHALQYKC